MSEFRFYSYTDFTYTTNHTEEFINLPIQPFTKTEEDANIELNIPYTVFEIIVAIVSIIGNLMVIIVFRRERKLRRRTNYYIVSLAIADFLVGSLGVPFAILASIGLPKNLHACLFTVSLLVVLCTISIFCLVAVSVDRYWAILYPMAYSRNVRTRTAIVIISVCWVAGAIVGFLPLFGWHADVPHNQDCLFVEVMDYDYLVFLYFATIMTPALLMLAFYTHIYRVIIKQVRQIVTMNPASDLSRRSSTAQMQVTHNNHGRGGHTGTMLRVLGAARKRDVKATQNLSIIVLFFMICWIPLYTINCIKAFCPECYVHPKVTLFCIILSHLNSAVNPVLYAYHLKDFRLALKNLMLRLMGVDIDQRAEAAHRFSVASQHRLQSMDSNMRTTQPRMYVDSPIWLRQQQEALKNSQLLPKCGVLTPCVNSINQTMAVAVTVSTDIERDMWNIVEASSGAERGEISCEFPNVKHESDRDSSISVSPPATAQPAAQLAPLEGCDSPYSYDNHNYSTGPEDGISLPDDPDYEDVFVPPSKSSNFQGVDPVELRRSLACFMREKLRSDDTDYYSQERAIPDGLSSQQELNLEHEVEVELRKPCSTRTSPTNGSLPHQLRSKLLFGGSSSDHCLPQPSTAADLGVYVIEGGTNPLSPGHKPKYRKSTALTRNSRKKSRSCSCTSEQKQSTAVEATRTTAQQPNNNLSQRHSTQPHYGHFFSPLKSVGNFMQHSNFFNPFQPHTATSASATTAVAVPVPAPTASRLNTEALTSRSASSSSSLVPS